MPFFRRAAGSYAEYLVAPSRMPTPEPAGLDHVQAAALPLVGLNVWRDLADDSGVGPGARMRADRAPASPRGSRGGTQGKVVLTMA